MQLLANKQVFRPRNSSSGKEELHASLVASSAVETSAPVMVMYEHVVLMITCGVTFEMKHSDLNTDY